MSSPVRSPLDVLRRRAGGSYEIDPWGYDADLVDLLDPVLGLFWRVSVTGEERVPSTGPAVLVANRRVGAVEPFVLARGIRRETGRRVRFLGIPDVTLLGPGLRRIGGAVHRPAELAALLRAGHVCAMPMSARLRDRKAAGRVSPESLVPALDLDVPVIPVAVTGNEVLGRWHVRVGQPVVHPASRGPLALAETAEAVRAGVQALLDEAHPPRWVFR